VKNVTTIALASVLILSLTAQVRAEEYYVYKSPGGRLVISNKPPPPESEVLRKLELPEAPVAETQPRQEGDNEQPEPAKPKPVVETP
jgi:hypothetical protein